MNNEQAIKVLLDEWKCIDRNDGINCDRQCEKCDLVMDSAILKDAYNMAIQALSQEPCDDAISREAVIMECIKYADHEHNVQLKKEVSETRKHDAQVIIYACDYFKTFVEKLPSVTQKSGKWMLMRTSPTKLYGEHIREYQCSECYREIRCTESQLVNYPYCHCGAKMESEDEK